MQQQMVGPVTRLAHGIEVAVTEEIGLHVHLLHFQLASLDLVVDPLVVGEFYGGAAAAG
jgi:hypothetical protein